MNNEERIERLLLALEEAIRMVDYYMCRPPESIFYSDPELEILRDYAKHEREKQGTMTMSNEVMEENKKVGE